MDKIISRVKVPIVELKNLPAGKEYLFEKYDRKNFRHVYLTVLVGLFWLTITTVVFASKSFDAMAQGAPFAGEATAAEKKPSAEFVSNEILIKVKKSVVGKVKENNVQDVGIESLNKLNKENKVKKIDDVAKPSGNSNADADIFSWKKITIDEPREVLKEKEQDPKLQKIRSLIAKYRADLNIQQVQLNYAVHAVQAGSTLSAQPTSSPIATSSAIPTVSSTPIATPTPTPFPPPNIPNDPYYSSSGSWGQSYSDLWGLKKINADGAWKESTGSAQIVVAVVDTGVDNTHPDLAANVLTNGWNFVSNNNTTMDDFGHGTHVAGIIGAVGNNGIGVVGVNWKVKIMPVKFLDSTGSGTDAAGADAIRYAVDNGAKVINNSWGGYGYSAVIHDAIEYAYSKNVVVVSAAGNDSAELSQFSPANETNTITVAASDMYDARANFSNWGAKVDVSAPGVNILSTRSSQDQICSGFIVGNIYCGMSGTSMATPHVSGLVALILSKNPNLKPDEVRQIIRSSADDIGVSGFDVLTGKGRINAQRALSMNSVLVAKIQNSGGVTANSSVDIQGLAYGAGFSSYILSYGAGFYPNSWTQISSGNAPVSSGKLGTWNASSLENNYYIIKLEVKDTSGRVFDDYRGFYLQQWVRPIVNDQSTNRYYPDIDGDKAVWSQQSNGGSVWVHDFVKNSDQLIESNVNGGKPVISGDNIVWINGNNVFLYNLQTGNKRQITSDNTSKRHVTIDGNYIAWEELLDLLHETYGNIHVYNLAIGSEKVIQRPNSYEYPEDLSISGSNLVYMEQVGTDGYQNIYVYNLATDSKQKIATSFIPGPPKIWGNRIVWAVQESGRPAYGYGVYTFDLQTGFSKRIDSGGPYLDISGDEIVADLIGGGIYQYDFKTNTKKVVVSGNTWFYPKISGNRVVFEGITDPTTMLFNVFVYDPPGSVPSPSPSPSSVPSPNPPPITYNRCDFNHDGVVNAADAQIVFQKYASGSKDLTYDVDGNGAVTPQDAQLVYINSPKYCY